MRISVDLRQRGVEAYATGAGSLREIAGRFIIGEASLKRFLRLKRETSCDERVCAEHRALDGKEFPWDTPPMSEESGEKFHPGRGYQCRCDAIPVVD